MDGGVRGAGVQQGRGRRRKEAECALTFPCCLLAFLYGRGAAGAEARDVGLPPPVRLGQRERERNGSKDGGRGVTLWKMSNQDELDTEDMSVASPPGSLCSNLLIAQKNK